MPLISEEECARRIKKATEDLRHDIAMLKRELEGERFRAAVAEWAVAGVLAHKVEIKYAVDSSVMRQANDLLDVARLLGRRAGVEVMDRARLAFKDYAQLYELRRNGAWHTAVETPPEFWPKPFRQGS